MPTILVGVEKSRKQGQDVLHDGLCSQIVWRKAWRPEKALRHGESGSLISVAGVCSIAGASFSRWKAISHGGVGRSRHRLGDASALGEPE